MLPRSRRDVLGPAYQILLEQLLLLIIVSFSPVASAARVAESPQNRKPPVRTDVSKSGDDRAVKIKVELLSVTQGLPWIVRRLTMCESKITE